MEAPPAISTFLTHGDWAMMPGERAALEGVIATLQPPLSIEIGTSHGGSLDGISRHSSVVHAFDLVRHADVTSERFPNVTFHIGDSHELLPTILEELASAGENVDFAFVDGDHSAEGVRRDLEDLLFSPSVATTVILLHDTLNEGVRTGLDEIDYDRFDKVRFVDLDFVQGRVVRTGRQKNELWGGLGLVVTGWALADTVWPRPYSADEVLESELDAQRNLVRLMEQSWSWRLTEPLRRARSLARRMAGPHR